MPPSSILSGIRHAPGVLHACAVLLVFAAAWSAGSCTFDSSTRWYDGGLPPSHGCTPGEVRCTSVLQRCIEVTGGTTSWTTIDDCAARGRVCASALLRCTACIPDDRSCSGSSVVACAADGSGWNVVQQCSEQAGEACRAGGCSNLCADAARNKSNVGCEYWAVDLDNAMVRANSNAAAQQFAVVVSNPQPDVTAWVTVDQDDAEPGNPPQINLVAQHAVPPGGLRVLKLGPREVDGSPDGTFDTGTGTALTRHAFRVRSTVPIVAYQFNPLDNVEVFSNDASLLKPVEAMPNESGQLEPAFVVAGWPQTIAHTDDPDTNFDPLNPVDLRAFVTIVGTRNATRVRFTTTTAVIPGGPVPPLLPGESFETTLGPFDVLNLETGGFLADFTGSIVEADHPLVVFTGNEASDAPWFDDLSNRSCCADHLEEQLDPIRTAGTMFFAPHMPNRSEAVIAAGLHIGAVEEPQIFRVVSVAAGQPVHVVTTLAPPDDVFVLDHRGAFRELTTTRDFTLTADHPVVLATVTVSQDAAGVPRPMPGGDPSLIILPPIQQFRSDYVFLTPDKYAFDFIVVAAPAEASVTVDGTPVDTLGCTKTPADGLTEQQRGSPDPPGYVIRCPLSFPVLGTDPTDPAHVDPGVQNDGVHRVTSNRGVGVIAYGFDERVSYGYAAGTQLEVLPVQ